MKLTAVLLLVIALLAGLRGEAQTVTISVKNAKLENVLKGFKKQTGYSFFYNEDLLVKATRVTLDLNNTQLADALTAIFSTQPALDYSINGPIVTIHEKAVVQNRIGQTNGNQQLPLSAGKTIKGRVFNKRYEALDNASVIIKGRNKGTSTGTDGSFKLDDLKEEDFLVVSYIGYNTAEMPVRGREAITFLLEESTSQLDEVVAQGYSKTTRRLSTSSVAKVSGEEVARLPVMNPLLALQGKVPGLVVTPVTGHVAGPIQMDVRGKGLLTNASANPLIIVDGTPLTVNSNLGVMLGDGPVQGFMAAMNPARSQSPLFGLNPKDIESIEVLKDIGATAIYGSSGANGVILITTKRGKPGSSNLNIDVNYGMSKVIRFWEMLNTPQYLEMRREAFKNDGITPTPYNAPDLTIWDSTRYTDWQRELWGNTGSVLNASIGYSGGTPLFSHRISANYSSVGDITRVSGKSETMGFGLSLDRRSENQKFSVSLSANYNYSFLDMINSPFISNLPPNAPSVLDSAGLMNYKAWANTAYESVLSSMESILKPVESRTQSFGANIRLSYQLAKGLNLVTVLGYRISNNDAISLDPIISKNPAWFPTGSAFFGKSQTSGWNFEPQLTYDTWLFGKGRLGLTSGFTIKKDKKENITVMAMGFSNDAMLRSIEQASFTQTTNSSIPYKYAGLMGRAEFVWDNKYVVNGIWRRDGSSRFAPGSRFGNFGSVGMAWIASDERWLKKMLSPVVSYFKIFANTGTAGNDGGGDYQYLSQWSRAYLINYDGKSPMVSEHAVNQDYHWQLTRELTAGMELRLLKKGSLTVTAQYYRRRVGNQLLHNPTPYMTGFSSVFGNWDATVQNSGWEFSLNASFIETNNFRWTGSVNAGVVRNILYSYPDIANSPNYSLYLVGQSINAKYLLNYLGVDPMTGLYQFQDYNKDGVINRDGTMAPLTNPSDLQKVVDMIPRVTGGVGQTFSYRNLHLFLAFDYKIQNGLNAFSSIGDAGTFGNIPVTVFNNRWQKPGDNARFAKFTTQPFQGYATNQSTIAYTDASFFRFSNISLSYNLPEKWLKRVGMKAGSFNISTRNIFVITRYEGIDPETQSFTTMPPAKQYTLGLSLTL